MTKYVMTNVMADIAAERMRQVEVEGWSTEHDDKHDMGEMANAAAAYAMTPGRANIPMHYSNDTVRTRIWPWDRKWLKLTNRRRDLVKAAALLVAEIERLDRKAGK